MDQKARTITEEEFQKLFLYNKIHDLLLIRINCYPLIYYFTRSLITSGLYRKKDSESPYEKSIGIMQLFSGLWFILEKLFKKVKRMDNSLDVLFISRNRFFNLKLPGNIQFKSDYLFGYVIHCIKKKHPKYNTSFISTHFEDMPKLKNINLYSLAEYGTIVIFIKAFLRSIKIYARWQLSKTSIINYLVKNNLNYTIPLFLYFFSFKTLFFNIYFDYCFQNILEITRPKIILGNDDMLSFKPLTNFNTILILMQSASIDKSKELFLKMLISNFFCEIQKSDFFLVTGHKYYEIKKNTTDSKQIIITGQPRYDVLYYINKIYNKKMFIEKYKINPYHKIILWITQCHDMNDDENIKNIKTVFSSIENLNDITLIIKQHPDEGIKYTKMILEYINKYSINAIITPTNSDTYEQIYVCDLMITKNSTAAVEALALNKPIIVLNLTNKPDILDYVEKGIALGVYKEKDLKISIEKLIRNDIDLVKNRESYIYESLYKIDGKASERVVNSLKI